MPGTWRTSLFSRVLVLLMRTLESPPVEEAPLELLLLLVLVLELLLALELELLAALGGCGRWWWSSVARAGALARRAAAMVMYFIEEGMRCRESDDGIANKTLEKPVVVDELVADGIPCVKAALIAIAINGLDVGVVLELLVNKFEAHGRSHGERGIKAMWFHGGIGG